MTYRIQVLAHTGVGDGPPSDPVIVGKYWDVISISNFATISAEIQ